MPSNLIKDVAILLSTVLTDTDEEYEFIVCVIAKVNNLKNRRLSSTNNLPTIYGYTLERTPLYLMRKGVMSNIPREGADLKLISGPHLAKVETVINRAKLWDNAKRLEFVGQYLKIPNNTRHVTAEPYLIYRSNALSLVKEVRKRFSKKNPTKIDSTRTKVRWQGNQLQIPSRPVLDLTNSEKGAPLFDVMYSLWVTSNRKEFSLKEISAYYKGKFKETIGSRQIASRKSNIFNKKIKKAKLEDCITWQYNRSKNRWLFDISL